MNQVGQTNSGGTTTTGSMMMLVKASKQADVLGHILGIPILLKMVLCEANQQSISMGASHLPVSAALLRLSSQQRMGLP
jgi:hypothetical protein